MLQMRVHTGGPLPLASRYITDFQEFQVGFESDHCQPVESTAGLYIPKSIFFVLILLAT